MVYLLNFLYFLYFWLIFWYGVGLGLCEMYPDAPWWAETANSKQIPEITLDPQNMQICVWYQICVKLVQMRFKDDRGPEYEEISPK